jgi:hypothetical protein
MKAIHYKFKFTLQGQFTDDDDDEVSNTDSRSSGF